MKVKAEELIGNDILWRHKNRDNEQYFKDYVQNIYKTKNGTIVIELNNTDIFTNYPTRYDIEDIEILVLNKK